MPVCMEKQYRDNWDLTTLTRKINQKCRDTKLSLKEEMNNDEVCS